MNCFLKHLEARETQWLITQIALLEDLSSMPSTHIRWFATNTYGLYKHSCMCVHAHTHIQIILNF